MEIAKFRNRTSVEYYVPKWNKDCTQCGLTEQEQEEQGYMPLIESYMPQTSEDEYATSYYEVVAGKICQRWEIIKVEPIDIEENGTNSVI